MLLTLARNRAIELVSKKLDKRTKPKPKNSFQNIQMDYCKLVSTLVLSKYQKIMEILKL